MKTLIRILHLEDDPNDVELVQAILEKAGLNCRINTVSKQDDFEKALGQDDCDIILADYTLPRYDGMSALHFVQESYPEVPFVFVSGTMGEEVAIKALRQGATDYVLKHNLHRLAQAVERALNEARNLRERKKAEQQVTLMSFALNGIHEAAFMTDENRFFHYVNDEACRLLGYTRDELLTMGPLDINPNISLERYLDYWNNLKAHGTLTFEEELKAKDGRFFPVEVNANFFEYKGKSYDLGIVRDISERKKIEQERLANLKYFESMDKINKAIQGSEDPEEMMKNLLDEVLAIFDCDRAFLMYPCDPESSTWTSPMERTKPEYPGVLEKQLDIPMDPQVAETLRIMLAADGPVAFGPGMAHELPAEVSQQFGFKSFMSMAIYQKSGRPWQLGIHQCAYARVWTAKEMKLFEAIGWRLADALSNLLAHRDLRSNEEFLDKIVEYIPNMIFVKDAQNLSFVRFNRAGEALLGYPREDMIGKNDHDFFPKEEADFFTAKDRQVLESKKLVDVPEETILTKGNQERILHTKKIPILDETGTPQYLLGISEDITERKKADESIRKLSQAIEQSPVSIVITDIKGRIEFVNAKFTQVTGYSFAEALGQNPRILKSGETSAEEYKRLWETISSGDIWQGEFQNRKKNGKLFWEQATIAPIRNEENIITHYVAVKEDITEHKKLEDQLLQTQKMESVGRLAGGVAHDFNNMLGVIGGFTELALDRVDATHPLYADLQAIHKASERSADLTRQLLAFARKQTVAPKVLDLNQTIEGMLSMLGRLIGEDIEVDWNPGKGGWPVRVDPSQIDQILANLCVNARDAMPGVGKLVIETGNKTFEAKDCTEQPDLNPGDYVMLAVSDEGHGMDKKTVEKIFEPFFTTKEMGKGTGLGLSTVYGIVKQNKGFIDVYSEVGHGTSFRIYLPRHLTLAVQQDKKRSEIVEVQGTETILLVEDDPTILEIGKRMLERSGYRVLSAGMPGEALQVAKGHVDKIDLLITDVIMPEMNGQELVDRLTSLFPGLKHVFISGYTGDIIADHGVLSEGDNFVQKPFTVQSLTTVVRRVLDKNHGSDDSDNRSFPESENSNKLDKQSGKEYEKDDRIPQKHETGGPASQDTLILEAMSRLPDALLADLKQAIVELDQDRIKAVIGQINALNSSTATYLLDLAADFQYEKLLALIDKESNDET